MDKYKQKLIHALSDINTDGEVVRWIERNFPELRESEEETTRKELLDFVRSFWADHKEKLPQASRWVTYLEKLKENPKSTDSIPSDCVSDAKCENGWHKTANSLPDDGRDVLAKDALGNYLLASFDGAQWFVSGYDDEDHPVLHTPPIIEWCDIPSEKQKDQKPIEDVIKNITKNKEATTKFLKSAGIMDDNGELAEMYRSEQKPAEWSEEDEKMCEHIISDLREFRDCETDEKLIADYEDEIQWLKSLRPQLHWKPSEEQMDALLNTLHPDDPYYNELKSLYEQLKKL